MINPKKAIDELRKFISDKAKKCQIKTSQNKNLKNELTTSERTN